MQTLTVGKTVKLKLDQPTVMCSGRGRVTCHYRAKVIAIAPDHKTVLLSFRYKGKTIAHLYSARIGGFVNPELKDTKLV